MESASEKTVLVTGCCGFIGGRFVGWLRDRKPNVTVVGIDNLSGAVIEAHKDITFYEVDLLNHEKVDEIFEKHSIDVVFHFAATPQEVLSHFIRRYNYENNLLATVNLINAAINKNVVRFVFTSSIAAIGTGDGKLPFTEETPLVPIDPYGAAKAVCETDLRLANDKFGMDYCIVRPRNVIGRGQNIFDIYRNVLSIWMYQLRKGEPITIYGDGTQKRAFTPIDDILEPLYAAGFSDKARNKTVNLGSSRALTVNELADKLEKCVGEQVDRLYLEKRHEADEAYCAIELSEKLLDYKEQEDSVDNCITDAWQWVKTLQLRERSKFEKIEVQKGLYSFWR